MPNVFVMKHTNAVGTAVFITFSGNCRKALSFYQTCFGGKLRFEFLGKDLQAFTEQPVVSGSLISERIILYGSDLVQEEGRKIGNYISIFLLCKNAADRRMLIAKLKAAQKEVPQQVEEESKLIELSDAFDVSWMLGI